MIPKPIHDFIHNVMPHMEGWCTPEKADKLAETILISKPTVCLEIGVFAGRSIIVTALSLHWNDKGTVIGIDPWDVHASISGFERDPANRDWWTNNVDHDVIFEQCREFVQKMGVSSRVDLLKMTSEQAYPVLKLTTKFTGPYIDFLHIDGNHSTEHAIFDVTHYVPLVRKGGDVWFDDCDWEQTKPAQKKLVESCQEIGRVSNCAIFRKL